MTRPLKFGELAAEEWSGRWKSSPSDPDLAPDEYHIAWKQWMDRLDSIGLKKGMYFRGDDYANDRTQYLELIDATFFSLDLLLTLQRWLKEEPYKLWRIAVITYVSDAATPMLYPHSIRMGKAFEDRPATEWIPRSNPRCWFFRKISASGAIASALS